MKGYEDAWPGAAERIFSMTEAQSKHRQGIETIVITGNVKHEGQAQWMAFFLSVIFLVCGTVLLALGKSLSGWAMVCGTIVPLVTAFLTAKNRRDKELARKKPDEGDRG